MSKGKISMYQEIAIILTLTVTMLAITQIYNHFSNF